MNAPETPLVWPEHFLKESRWDKFFMGVPRLGPDLSFFKELKAQQAGRTEAVMSTWPDAEQRRVALCLGECLQKQWGWNKPYFIPSDQTRAVIGGPDAWVYMEMDLADAYREFEDQLGREFSAAFWEAAVVWENKDACFGGLVRKIVEQLRAVS